MSHVPAEISKRLNMLRGSPGFVVAEDAEASSDRVLKVDRLPIAGGVYWVSGTIRLPGGQDRDAVHIVDADAGGELIATYVWVEEWLAIADLPSHLGVPRSEVFPYDYALAVTLNSDIFHDSSPSARPELP